MTLEEIEKEFSECVEAVRVLEGLTTAQETTYKVHTERLQLLKRLFTAAQNLKQFRIEAAAEDAEEETSKAEDAAIKVVSPSL